MTRISTAVSLLVVGCFALLAGPGAAQPKFHVLYTFQGGTDGGASVAALIRDHAGNLYGTATQGGKGCGSVGCGVVFKLAPDGSESVLYAFDSARDGDQPGTPLLRDREGNLFGTTSAGGLGCHPVRHRLPCGRDNYNIRSAGIDPHRVIHHQQCGHGDRNPY
ncbi:MAG TPA: choice-of-anchor tandem repeat GloVer-containing protein [Rhizomicrobium sp.]|nr:choice-of-anchor tandem repeat GloVer-containing protein [Rhizomicrobium sp.]